MSNIMSYYTSKGSRGFVFTLEAAIALLLFALMLTSLPQTRPQTLKELAIMQQADDLLRVWSAQVPAEGEMIADTKLVFGENAEVWLDKRQIMAAKGRKNSISAEGTVLDQLLSERKIKIIVNYD